MDIKVEYKINNNIIITNKSDDNINIFILDNKVCIKPLKDIYLLKANISISYKYHKDDLIFVNGYQSWTDTKEFNIKESLKDIYKVPKALVDKFSFDKYGDATFKKYSKHILHGFDYSYIRGINPLFIANKNYKNCYLIINHDIKNNQIILESDCKRILNKNSEFTIFDYDLISDDIDITLNNYFKKSLSKDNIFGYTSWYNHYQNINEEIILSNLEAIDERFNLFQIDDGYQTYVGDWLDVDKVKFPNGLNAIVSKIESKNKIPGLWLAPFVAEEKSRLFKEHKELFAKDKFGNFIKCGANWSGFYVLDIFKEESKAYIVKCLKHYKNMGFKLFKLDFLYSVGLIENNNLTKAMITDYAYNILSSSLEGCEILGCGAVISSAINHFSYMRIGPDVSLIFDDVWYMKYFHRERISTKVTLQNTIYRSIFARSLFLNDPDVFLLRDDNIKLNNKQKYALAIINALFGNVLMTSDNITLYDDNKNKILNELLYINKKAINKYYLRHGKYIDIYYEIDNKKIKLCYNTKRGIFI